MSEMDDAIAAGNGTLHGAIDYWQARAEKAEAERDALRADAELLDWFVRHADAVNMTGYGADDRWVTLIYNDGNLAEGETLRAAIDSARGAA
jgi:hypothetical protein